MLPHSALIVGLCVTFVDYLAHAHAWSCTKWSQEEKRLERQEAARHAVRKYKHSGGNRKA